MKKKEALKEQIHIINILAWAKIMEELLKRGVKFNKGFSGIGDSYAGFITLCEETEPKLLKILKPVAPSK